MPDIGTGTQDELAAASKHIKELEGGIRNWTKAFATFRLGLRSTFSQHGIRSNPGWSDGDFEAAIDQLGNERDREKALADAAEASLAALNDAYADARDEFKFQWERADAAEQQVAELVKERDALAYTLTRTQAQIHAMADAAGVLTAHQ